eukprot:g4707.t1
MSLRRSALANVANQRANPPPSSKKAHKQLSTFRKKRSAGSGKAVRRSLPAPAAGSDTSSAGLFIFGSSPVQKQRAMVRCTKRQKIDDVRDDVDMRGGQLNMPATMVRAVSVTPDACPCAPNNTPAGVFTNAVRRRGEIKPTDLFVELFSHTSILQPSGNSNARNRPDIENVHTVEKELEDANGAFSHGISTRKLLGKRVRQQEDERAEGASAPSEHMFSSCSGNRSDGGEMKDGEFFACSLQ